MIYIKWSDAFKIYILICDYLVLTFKSSSFLKCKSGLLWRMTIWMDTKLKKKLPSSVVFNVVSTF